MANETKIDSLSKLRKADAEGIVRRVDGYRFKFSELHIKPGFNARGVFMEPEEYWNQPDVVAYIEGLALSYASGVPVPPITISVVDGKSFVHNGEHRYRGFELALKKYGVKQKADPKALGLKDEYIDVIEYRESAEGESSLSLLDFNNGRNFSAIETAVLYQRAIEDGHKVEYIAQRSCKSVPHVYKYLTAVNKWGDDLLSRVQRGELSFTAAQAIYEETRRKPKQDKGGDEGSEPSGTDLQGDAENQMPLSGTDLQDSKGADEGDSTVSNAGSSEPKQPGKTKAKGISKQISDSIVSLIFGLEAEAEGDTYTLTLTKEQYDAIKTLQEQVETELKNL